MTRASRFSLLGLLAAALVFPQIVSDPFVLRLAIQCGVFILLASAHNILIKVKQLSLGPVAFYGLGAYVSAILTTRLDVPFLIAFFAAGLTASAVGWILGRLTLRLRAAYFVLVTLGFAEFFRLVALNWIDMTNGPMGITAVPPPATWFKGYVAYYFFILLLVAVVLCGLYRLEHSTIGRAMRAIRENEPLALSVGISSFRYMVLATVLSSFIMGLAGSFYAHFSQFVSPEILVFDLTLTIVVMVIAGGRATVAGPVVGAIIFTVLPELLRVAQVWRMAIFGLLLMLIMRFMPDGILPSLSRFVRRLVPERAKRVKAHPKPVDGSATSAAPAGPIVATEQHSPSSPEFPESPSGGEAVDGSRSSETLLRVKELCVYFGGLHAVDEVDFEVKASEILAIIGPNGAGKTTILNAISRFGPITAGEIWHHDELLNDLYSHEVARRGIVRTFQHTKLFPNVSTRQNLVLAHNGMEPEALYANLFRTRSYLQAERQGELVADQILEFLRLNSYGSFLANSLPYGHQRLLELGIALALEPKVLLLDEPAAGMNPAEVVHLMTLIKKIRDKGITVVLVEHDMKLVMGISDRVLALDYGKKIAEGRPAEIRANERVVEAYLGRRSEQTDEHA